MALLLLLAVASGCRTCSVSMAEGIEPQSEWRVAVLPLDDSSSAPSAADYTLFGHVGAQGSGILVAQDLSAAFAQSPSFKVIPESEIRRIVHDNGPPASGQMDDSLACQLGRSVKADLVITGRVHVYDTTWFLFIPRSRVRMELRGLAADVDRLLWTARLADCSHVRSEREMVLELAKGLVEKAAEGLALP